MAAENRNIMILDCNNISQCCSFYFIFELNKCSLCANKDFLKKKKSFTLLASSVRVESKMTEMKYSTDVCYRTHTNTFLLEGSCDAISCFPFPYCVM